MKLNKTLTKKERKERTFVIAFATIVMLKYGYPLLKQGIYTLYTALF